jgi:molybdopterin synthase sulfur carrier subunit
VTLLYFAWVRQKIGRGEEQFELPSDVKTIADLAAHLAARGGGYAEVFSDTKRLRAALNQEHVPWDAPVSANDEIAFFPPVTGG